MLLREQVSPRRIHRRRNMTGQIFNLAERNCGAALLNEGEFFIL